MFVHGFHMFFHALLSIFLTFHIYMFVDDFVMWTFNSISLLKVNNQVSIKLTLKAFFFLDCDQMLFSVSTSPVMGLQMETNMLNYNFVLT